MSAKKTLRDTIIILAITFGLLIVSETILRIIFPEKIKISNKPKFLAYEFNEDYLISIKPNIEKTFSRSAVNGGDIIHWKTNNDSFRGNDLKENPQIRIIVYGDSSIQTRFSKLENTFVYRLEIYLQENEINDMEVINAGIIGFGPDQSLIRFAKEADIYNPDIVIFHICADNDFGDIIKNRLFELDQLGNLVETGYRKTVDQRLKQETDLNDFISSLLIVKAVRKAVNLLAPNKKQYDAAENIIQKYAYSIEQQYSIYKKSMPRKFSTFGDHYDLDIAIFPDAESSKTKIKLMNAVLKRAKALADSKCIEFLVLIQPSIIDLTENFKFSYKHLQSYPGYRRRNITDAVENICIANNIHCINFFDVFLRNNPADLFFKKDNDHWNDQGQDIAAKETALYISSETIPNSNRLTNRSSGRANARR